MWKCSLLVRAGSPSSAAERSGDKDKAVGGMSAFHFPNGKPSPAGQDSEEREQLPRPTQGTVPWTLIGVTGNWEDEWQEMSRQGGTECKNPQLGRFLGQLWTG